MDTKKKLSLLRKKMADEDLSAWLQPVHDEYLNEYPPASARRVEWLSGFTGSAGTAAVMKDKAAFFVDGRYVLQAKEQVDAVLFEQHNIETLRLEMWLAQHLKPGQRVGYDPRLTTQAALKRLETAVEKKGVALVAVSNLVDRIWERRPPAPRSPVIVHDKKYTGETHDAKRARIAASVKKAGADAAVIAAPDSVCWLLNIRASDVEGAPLLLAPAIINTAGEVKLFVDAKRCNEDVRKHLGSDVSLSDPSDLEAALIVKGKSSARVLCDRETLPVWYSQTLAAAGAWIVDGHDPCLLPKAMKNAAEIKGMKDAHIRDGAAVAKLLCWLDGASANHITEIDVAEKLLELRSAHRLFRGPSFHTIAGSGPHGAIVHYRATTESNRTLGKGELFLLDSGGQYPDGTTDITRTVPVGKPSKEHKDRFTRVLKGHIAIATAQFPEGTCGSQLDALARQYLWQQGCDYDHGTGHGVGHFLNVHEGPQRISKRGGDAPLNIGMVVSNEPGYYKSGAYGIRIESLVTVVEKRKDAGGKAYLGFETLTCAPIDTRLVDETMLTETEKEWLNDYHAWVFKQLADALDNSEKNWLSKRCAAI